MFLFGGPIPFLINKYKLNVYNEEEEIRKGQQNRGKCGKCLDYLEEKVFRFFVDQEQRQEEIQHLQVS